MAKQKSLKPFFLLWSGQALSLLGSRLVQFALIWWLTRTTESATVLALASLVGLLPQVLLGPFVGVLVDRWQRRRVMLLADSVVALATLFLGLLFWLDIVQIWHLFLVLFVRALGGTFHWPAMQAATTLMVPEEHLTRIQGMNQMLNGGLGVVAAPLGALLLELLPIAGIIAIDVATALFAILPLLLIHIPEPGQVSAGIEKVAASFRDELVAGLRYVRGWPGMMILIGFATAANLLLQPAFSLLPILVTDHFQGNAFHLGWLEAGAGVGIIAGGVLLSVWGGFSRRILTTLTGVLGLGLAVTLTALVPASWFPLAVFSLFAVGGFIALTDGPLLAIVQAVVAPEMQGRVMTLLGSMVKLASPVGLILAGPLSDLVGVRYWFLAAGLVCLLLGTAGFFSPRLLSIEDQRRAPAPEEAAEPAPAVADHYPSGITG